MKGEMIVIPDNQHDDIKRRQYTVPVEELQAGVGGPIELIPYFRTFEGKRCVAFCNEEGKLPGRSPFLQGHHNAEVTQLWWNQCEGVRDVLYGPVVILTGDKEFMEAL